MLHQAAALLAGKLGGPHVAAVSLMEKTLQGAQGALGSGGRALKAQSRPIDESDWKNLVLSVPAISSSWNLTEVQDKLSEIYYLFSENARAKPWSRTPPPEGIRRCTPSLPNLCAPKSWWKDWSQDVWLVPSAHFQSAGGAEGGQSFVALFNGLFLPGRGFSYDHAPSAQTALGIPPCYACHQVRPTASDFTVYISVLDVLGPCRELFSNIFMDALEALQLASFQGPQVVLVEPFICNAVWQRYGELAAGELRAKALAEGRDSGLFLSYYNKETISKLL